MLISFQNLHMYEISNIWFYSLNETKLNSRTAIEGVLSALKKNIDIVFTTCILLETRN